MKSFLFIMMITGGLWIIALGWQEWRIAQAARTMPSEVSLADLQRREANGVEAVSENAHVRFGPCLALYQSAMYSYRQSLLYGGGGGPSTELKDVFVPIVPVEDPRVEALSDPLSPQARRGMTLAHLKHRVLLKTRRVTRIGDIPKEEQRIDMVQGIIVNDVRALDSNERGLLELNARHMNPAEIIIIEEGRRPLGMTVVWGILGAGALSFLMGAWGFLRR